jgi:hypothetical protein
VVDSLIIGPRTLRIPWGERTVNVAISFTAHAPTAMVGICLRTNRIQPCGPRRSVARQGEEVQCSAHRLNLEKALISECVAAAFAFLRALQPILPVRPFHCLADQRRTRDIAAASALLAGRLR